VFCKLFREWYHPQDILASEESFGSDIVEVQTRPVRPRTFAPFRRSPGSEWSPASFRSALQPRFSLKGSSCRKTRSLSPFPLPWQDGGNSQEIICNLQWNQMNFQEPVNSSVKMMARRRDFSWNDVLLNIVSTEDNGIPGNHWFAKSGLIVLCQIIGA
jgi:hypothetical protein